MFNDEPTKFEKLINKFSNDYTGKPLSIVCAGGGASLFDLLKLPGSTQFIHNVKYLNSYESVYDYLETKNNDRSNVGCNKATTSDIANKNYNLCSLIPRSYGGEFPIPITINAALTSKQFRKGENRAYICIDAECWKINFMKINEVLTAYENPTKSKEIG